MWLTVMKDRPHSEIFARSGVGTPQWEISSLQRWAIELGGSLNGEWEWKWRVNWRVKWRVMWWVNWRVTGESSGESSGESRVTRHFNSPLDQIWHFRIRYWLTGAIKHNSEKFTDWNEKTPKRKFVVWWLNELHCILFYKGSVCQTGYVCSVVKTSSNCTLNNTYLPIYHVQCEWPASIVVMYSKGFLVLVTLTG